MTAEIIDFAEAKKRLSNQISSDTQKQLHATDCEERQPPHNLEHIQKTSRLSDRPLVEWSDDNLTKQLPLGYRYQVPPPKL